MQRLLHIPLKRIEGGLLHSSFSGTQTEFNVVDSNQIVSFLLYKNKFVNLW